MFRLFALTSLLFSGFVDFNHASESTRKEFITACVARLSDARVIAGEDPNWFFPSREIRQLSLGNFWEKPWPEVSRNGSNPIPSMVDFHNQLEQKGIDLLVVPIPAKATVYPEKLSGSFQPGEAQGMAPFLKILEDSGLNVLDLESIFVAARKEGLREKLWCAQDAHFSPAACVTIADLVAERLHNDFGVEKRSSSTALQRQEPRQIEIVGDLVAHTERDGKVARERLPVRMVGNSGTPIEPDPGSPVLLLGDSHTLVFSDELNFHCDGAGLFDHLSSSLGYPVDLEGSASGGLMTSRINLYRKVLANPGYWSGKKAVVWVFTAREFTQSSFNRDFMPIPIERK